MPLSFVAAPDTSICVSAQLSFSEWFLVLSVWEFVGATLPLGPWDLSLREVRSPTLAPFVQAWDSTAFQQSISQVHRFRITGLDGGQPLMQFTLNIPPVVPTSNKASFHQSKVDCSVPSIFVSSSLSRCCDLHVHDCFSEWWQCSSMWRCLICYGANLRSGTGANKGQDRAQHDQVCGPIFFFREGTFANIVV